LGNWISLGYEGLATDPARGIALLDYTCKTGSIRGCNDLGRIYQVTDSSFNNIDEAIHYYRLACNGDYAEGCANLGNMLYDGKGIEQDREQALRLMQRGCRSGHRWSCELLVERDQVAALPLLDTTCKDEAAAWACELASKNAFPVDKEAQCFDLVQGKVAWSTNGSKNWVDANVIDLCEGTQSPPQTVACFQRGIASDASWGAAIADCKRDITAFR
jgi:hypothetical protein